MESGQDKWLSLYLFHHGDADQLLKQLIYPFIKQWRTPWFFIRYWEGGDHIRLRLKAVKKHHQLIAKSLSAETSVIKLIQMAEYEPEIDRYGNLKSILWAERYFECSSAYILNWIANKQANQSPMAQAIKLHLTLLFSTGWDKQALISLCNSFLEGWLPKLFNQTKQKEQQRLFWLNQFETVFLTSKIKVLKAAEHFWQALDARNVDGELNTYLSETITIIKLYKSAGFEEDKLFQIISSFIHMNNNRLGISNDEEAYIMYCIMACLQFIHKKPIQ
ncbi:thiopeptide-type bacteriocin biosynthesis protein [Pedobacter sp. PF22-3]|uniref:thiopeptide-type bacteriocin biosynthesis protein n=1 Tax=Pedobacter sp. PF22-3 TaxID=2994467 RepID=UPI0022480597|nr:thiopeptide-type bacteriocin biosynthesis protein [Pedobacter sp. PF22-3]MCX2491973.1 thiopeptide-type bacteriocin biosynthesis protein [Pedobacter sp. PF22-3]